MEEDQRALAGRAAIGVGEDVLVDLAGAGFEVVQPEVARPGELGPPVEQREDRPLVMGQQALVDRLVEAGAPELHPVLLAEALDLAVAEHRQAGQRRQQGGHPEVLVAGPELLDRRLLVGVAHEVHEAAEDRRVELEGVLHDLAVLGVAARRGACS